MALVMIQAFRSAEGSIGVFYHQRSSAASVHI